MNRTINRRRFLAAGAAGLTSSFLSGQNNSTTVQVHIDPSRTLGAIPDDFLGFGYEISSVGVKGLLSPGNHTLVQYYRNLGKQGVVRIGGNTADFATWSPEGQAVSAPKATVTNREVIADLGRFLHATGWKLIWNLNLGSGTAESAADQAGAVADAAKDRLLCFQIGNEPDLFARSGHRQSNYDYAEYHQEFSRFASELRKRLPGAPIGGPDVAGATQWVSLFANDEGKQIKLLTEHYYRAGQRQPAATFENLLHTDPRFISRVNELRADSRRYGVPYRLVELNSFSGGGKPGVSDTFASALWALDLLFTLSSYEGAGLNLETGLNQLGFVSSYSPIFDDRQGHLTARPSYYAMLAFSLAGRGERLPTDVTASDANFTAYGVLDRLRHSWVTLINKDVSKRVQIAISSQSNFASAEVMHLSAPSFDAKGGVTLAEAEVSADGHWKARNVDKPKVTGGHVTLDLAPASAALVRLS
jgi:hypothetical protein